MPEIKKAFTICTGSQKIRIAGSVQQTVTSSDPSITARNGMMNTALGLLAKGDMNCAGSIITPKTDLFDVPGSDIPTTKIPKPNDTGVVMTPAEKKRIEDERRRKADEDAQAAQREQERARAEQEAAERNKGGLFSRIKKSSSEFIKKLISEEAEDDNRG